MKVKLKKNILKVKNYSSYRKIIIAVGHRVVEAWRATLGDLDVLSQASWEVCVAKLQQISIGSVLVAEKNSFIFIINESHFNTHWLSDWKLPIS